MPMKRRMQMLIKELGERNMILATRMYDTSHSQPSERIHQSDARRGNRGQHQNTAHRNSRAVLVADRAEDKPHANVEGNGADVGCPDILGTQVEIFLDLGQERRNGEPDEEGNEEGPPREVERPTRVRVG